LEPTVQRHGSLSLKTLGPQQDIDEIDQQAKRDQTTQEVIQDHAFSSAMGLALEPLTAHDIGQAAGKKERDHRDKEQIEHVQFLPHSPDAPMHP
jgi:hypothetical protein